MFKHTANLMGISPTSPQDAAAAAKEAKSLRLYQDKLIAEAHLLQELANHPGWKVFVDTMKTEELLTYSMLEKANDPITLAKLTGTLLVVKSFQTWADDRAKDLLEAIAVSRE